MEKILMSACLLGDKVRYNAQGENVDSEIVKKWLREDRIVRVCPEMAGGLPTPRPPAEIVGLDGGAGVWKGSALVKRQDGMDVSKAFQAGANFALALAKKNGIKIAILKEKSPSCGTHQIYDGSFLGKKISDMGVTAVLLEENGIKVFSENEIVEAAAYLAEREKTSAKDRPQIISLPRL